MLKKLKERESQGFTLIEIVLVLAIAGLIMLIVFLAVAGAQRSRRDTQRKNDASIALAQVETDASNANGTYPASGTIPGFSQTDPTSNAAYTVQAAAPTAIGQIQYAGASHTCAGNAMGTGTANQVAVVIYLEAGTTACFHN